MKNAEKGNEVLSNYSLESVIQRGGDFPFLDMNLGFLGVIFSYGLISAAAFLTLVLMA